MPMNCKLSAIRERWCTKLCLVCILGLVTVATIWVFSNLQGTLIWTWQTLNYCTKNAGALLAHFNFRIHASTSSLSESDQNTFQRMLSRILIEDQSNILSLCLVKICCWLLFGIILRCIVSRFHLKFWNDQNNVLDQQDPVTQPWKKQQQQSQSSPKGAGKWRKKLLLISVSLGVIISIWLFWHLNNKTTLKREMTLANMCDERARMLQDQFNVSINHVHALAVLVSTFHHGKNPSAIDQKTFGLYTERTAFERPLTSGVAYAVKVPQSEREHFEKQHGWTIKKMETEDQTLVQDCITEELDPAPIHDEYAPVIFSQETVSHIVSIDMMSGKEDRENILRARASGKGVLTSPFKLLKSNHVGVVLTFAVYNADLSLDATPEQRIEAALGYLGASYDIPSLVEKLLHQLASKQTIVVHVYDTTNSSAPIKMYGDEINDTGLLHVSTVDFGDPQRKHEMHCRFKQKAPLPWTAISSSLGFLVITLLVGHIFHAAINRIDKVEEDYRKMMELKTRAEAADVAKSQFLATVSHEIRTPMTGVLGMLQLLMDSDLNANQLDFAQTAHTSGRYLISLINEVLDQSKIEAGRLELEAVPFDLRAILDNVLDNVLSLFSNKPCAKAIELAVYVSDRVPEIVVGDPSRFQQIITNLVGNSVKFTHDKGHIFVSVHLADEINSSVYDVVLRKDPSLAEGATDTTCNTLSGFPVVDRWKSWEKFKNLNFEDTIKEPEFIRLLITVEDTGVGIPLDAQSRIFTPFMQADSSTSRTYGGTGIGLSISKRLVELMHGEIGFVSKPGTGSTFSFTGALRKEPKRVKQDDPNIAELSGQRALVVDNRSIRAEVTRYHLQRLKLSVDITSSLNSACTYLSSTSSTSTSANLQMVLIDNDVWDKKEIVKFHQFLKELKQSDDSEDLNKFPKILLLATSTSINEVNELKLAGLLDHVLSKPLRLSALVACIQEAFGRGAQHKKKPLDLRNVLKERRILVVDDNVVNRRVAEGALKKYGASVTCVESGKAAITMLKPPHDFDACFMDLQMPEMDGFEATRQIRYLEVELNHKMVSGEDKPEKFGKISQWRTPILAMTADVTQASSEECLKCGMDDYVYKPFEEEQLYTAVARFFESNG